MKGIALKFILKSKLEVLFTTFEFLISKFWVSIEVLIKIISLTFFEILSFKLPNFGSNFPDLEFKNQNYEFFRFEFYKSKSYKLWISEPEFKSMKSIIFKF